MQLEALGAKTTQLAGEAVREPLASNACHASLFDRVGERIYRYFLKTAWDPNEAEELAQRTFLDLTRSLRNGSYDPGRSFNAWLWIKAHATFVDWCRERRRRMQPLNDGEIASPSSEVAIDEQLDANAILQVLQQRLGNECYEIFVLYYEGGLTQSEIAEAVGRDRKTVAKRLAQAHELAQKFDKETRHGTHERA